jgi:hypothetical protein
MYTKVTTSLALEKIVMRSLSLTLGLLVCTVQTASAYEPLDFAFGENGSWVVIYKSSANRRVWKYVNLLPDAAQKIEEYSNEGNVMRGVGLDGKAGWVVISEDRYHVYTTVRNVYASVAEKIKEIRAEGWYIKDIALTSEGGYAIIYGQSNSSTNGWTYQNVPQGLADIFDQLKRDNGSPTGVGIAPSGGWVIVYTHRNCGKWHLRSGGTVPAEAARFINEKF